MRRFPAPWSVEAIDGGFKVVDANKQSIAYVYGHADPRDAGIANSLSLDEARRREHRQATDVAATQIDGRSNQSKTG